MILYKGEIVLSFKILKANSLVISFIYIISLEKQSIYSGESIKVTAAEEGSVYLTAYVKDNKNISDTIVVTVSKVKLTAMTAVPTKDELLINETAQFTVTIYPNTIPDKSVTYKSSDENIGYFENVDPKNDKCYKELQNKNIDKFNE